MLLSLVLFSADFLSLYCAAQYVQNKVFRKKFSLIIFKYGLNLYKPTALGWVTDALKTLIPWKMFLTKINIKKPSQLSVLTEWCDSQFGEVQLNWCDFSSLSKSHVFVVQRIKLKSPKHSVQIYAPCTETKEENITIFKRGHGSTLADEMRTRDNDILQPV